MRRIFRFTRMTLAGAVMGTLFGFVPGAAAQETFTACYVPEVGAVYMIKIEGLPQSCLDGSHVEFSWTTGAPVDGTVTTAALADGAVTTTKLADAAVTLVKMGFDVATQDELDAAVATAVADGSITSVKLADGAVTTAKISDGVVTAAKLSFDPATQTELNAVTSDLETAGTINQATNPVSWSKLKDVPGGLADGVDDGFTTLVDRTGSAVSIAPGTTAFATVDCQTGEVVVGGGGNNMNAAGVYLIQSWGSGARWSVTYHNTTTATRTIYARALCAR